MVMGGFASISYFFYVREGQKSVENVAVYNAQIDDTGELIGSNSPIRLLVTLTDVDPVRSVVKFNTKARFDNASAELVNGSMLLGSYKRIKLSGKHYEEMDISLIADGDPNHYPFDVYTVELPYAVTTGNVLADAMSPSANWSGYAFAALQNYRFDLKFVPHNETSIVSLQVTVMRSPTAKGFSLFIVLLMWLLSTSAVTIAFHSIFRMREVPPNLVSIFVSLLFALPSVRNTQPAVPPIGTLLDAISLFWNMVMVSICAISMMMTFIYQSPDPNPPEYGRTGSTTTLVSMKG